MRHYGPAQPPYTAPGPWATGDAQREGKPLNLAPYGGSYLGLMAALVVPTGTSSLPAFNLLATDWHHAPAWPTFLVTNPGPAPVTVTLPEWCAGPGVGAVDVYDSVGQGWVATGVPVTPRGVPVPVPAGGTLVASLVPTNGTRFVRAVGRVTGSVTGSATPSLRCVLEAGGRVVDFAVPCTA